MTKKNDKKTYNASIVGDGAIAQGSGAVAIGAGSVNVVQVGNGNIVVGNKFDDIKSILERINGQISKMNMPLDLQIDLRAELYDLFELLAAEKPDEKRITLRLRILGRISPDVLDLVLSSLMQPIIGIDSKTRKVVESFKQKSA